MLQNLRIFVSGENLLTITSLSDTMDPEHVVPDTKAPNKQTVRYIHWQRQYHSDQALTSKTKTRI